MIALHALRLTIGDCSQTDYPSLLKEQDLTLLQRRIRAPAHGPTLDSGSASGPRCPSSSPSGQPKNPEGPSPALWEHQLGLYTAGDHDQGLVTPFNPLRGPDGLSSPGAITPGPVK